MDPRIRYYNEMLATYGPNDVRALAWRNSHSQQDRFQILSEVANLDGASILDEGCGVGDLYQFLIQKYGDVAYQGIDINEKLIEAAIEKYPGVPFSVADFSLYNSVPVDYVLASGTLTYKIPQYGYVYLSQIEKMFRLSKKAVAFNVLDEANFKGNDLFVTYNKAELRKYCETLTNNVVVRDDYSTEDLTFYLYH